MPKLKRVSRKRKIFIILIVAILLAVLIDAFCVYDYGKEDETRSADAAIVLGDPLHMKRSMIMAKDLGIEAFTSPVPNSMYQSFRTKSTFLMREVFFDMGYLIYRIFK